MRLTCPACGAEQTLDVAVAHDGARRALVAAMQVGPALSDRVLKYLALFRPAKRQLTMDRVAALLDELVPMIRAARVTRNGVDYSAPVDTWRAALDTVLAHRDGGKLALPLKSHGYLLAVIAGMVDRAEGRAEQAHEDKLRSGTRDNDARTDARASLERLANLAAPASPLPDRVGPAPDVAAALNKFLPKGKRFAQ